MRTSIYDALDVGGTSTSTQIKAALRTVVRRFWSVPRDASGDSEEAIRFVALAASILLHDERRKNYDAALDPGVGAGPWRVSLGNRDAVGDSSVGHLENAEGSVGPSQLSVRATPSAPLPCVAALAEPLPESSAWAASSGYPALLAAATMLFFACMLPIYGADRLTLVQALAVTLAVLTSSLVLALVATRPRASNDAGPNLSRLAIIKWRRESSIFVGVPPPQHDTAWIFKLRLMELTRSAASFVSLPYLGRRIWARLIDYLLVALIVYALLALFEYFIQGHEGVFLTLRSPLVLPVLAVVLAIAYEIACCRAFRTTPGKWLFSLVPVFAVTRPDDVRQPTTPGLVAQRAVAVAISGASLGIWPIALFRMARLGRNVRDSEPVWDAKGDTVVVGRPLSLSAVAAALVMAIAMCLVLYSAWRKDLTTVKPALAAQFQSLRAVVLGHMPSVLSARPEAVAPTAVIVTSAAPVSVAVANDPAVASAAAQTPATVASVAQPTRPLAAPVASPPVTQAEVAMDKQTRSATERRTRIDRYAAVAADARRSGSYGAAQGSCQRWIQDQPGSAEAWRCLGLAQFQNGAGRDALPALRQALKLEPRDAQVESAILRILRP